MKELLRFLGCMLLMNIEVTAIAYLISATSAKNRMGLGLGIALIVYVYDIMGRVVPDLKDYLFIGPFSFANASEIFAGYEAPDYSLLLSVIVILATTTATFLFYTRKDLAA